MFHHDNAPVHKTRTMKTQIAKIAVEKNQVSCTEPWPWPHWAPLGWMPTLHQAILALHQCLTSLRFLWINASIPIAMPINLAESFSRRVDAFITAKEIKSGMSCSISTWVLWSGIHNFLDYKFLNKCNRDHLVCVMCIAMFIGTLSWFNAGCTTMAHVESEVCVKIYITSIWIILYNFYNTGYCIH